MSFHLNPMSDLSIIWEQGSRQGRLDKRCVTIMDSIAPTAGSQYWPAYHGFVLSAVDHTPLMQSPRRLQFVPQLGADRQYLIARSSDPSRLGICI